MVRACSTGGAASQGRQLPSTTAWRPCPSLCQCPMPRTPASACPPASRAYSCRRKSAPRVINRHVYGVGRAEERSKRSSGVNLKRVRELEGVSPTCQRRVVDGWLHTTPFPHGRLLLQRETTLPRLGSLSSCGTRASAVAVVVRELADDADVRPIGADLSGSDPPPRRDPLSPRATPLEMRHWAPLSRAHEHVQYMHVVWRVAGRRWSPNALVRRRGVSTRSGGTEAGNDAQCPLASAGPRQCCQRVGTYCLTPDLTQHMPVVAWEPDGVGRYGPAAPAAVTAVVTTTNSLAGGNRFQLVECVGRHPHTRTLAVKVLSRPRSSQLYAQCVVGGCSRLRRTERMLPSVLVRHRGWCCHGSSASCRQRHVTQHRSPRRCHTAARRTCW